MEKVLKIYSRLSYFILLLVVFVLAGAWVISSIPKGELELWVNQHRTTFFDHLFYYATSLGNGLFFLAIVILLFIVKREYFWLSALTGIACLVVSATMKYLVFEGEPRPAAFFEDNMHLNFIEGVPKLYSGSFPSGHTLTAFSIAVLLSYILKPKMWQVLFFALALTVGISRIYLLAHFKEDVYAGAILGSVISWLLIYIFERFFPGGKFSLLTKVIRVKVKDENG